MIGKQGYSTGFTWIFGIITIFGLGLLYIIFNQVFRAHMVPTMKNIIEATPTTGAIRTTCYNNIDKWMSYWSMLPFLLFGTVVLYMIIAAIRKEQDEVY